MSVAYTDVIRGAYQLLGRPSQADLPYQDMIDHAKDVIRGRLLDMKMAARGHTNVIGPWVAPTGQEMPTTAFTTTQSTPNGVLNFIPVKVEWRVKNDSSEQLPRKAEVMAWEQLGENYRSVLTFAETFVAFTDNFSKIAFSEVYETLQFREYRIIYETLDDVDVELGSSTNDLPALFITLCKYETAVMCLDQVVNESMEWAEKRERLRSSLIGRLAVEERRFYKWNTTAFGNKKVKRLGFRTRTR
jgi:hypothetical protein